MEFILLGLIGIVLGISAAIPGLSLGTMAVTFNVYDRLIDIITPNVKKILANWKFWLPLLIGIGGGVVLFSKLASFLFDNYPIPTYWFFIGLIAGSIPLIYNKARAETSVLPSVSTIICIVIALAVILFFDFLKPDSAGETAVIHTELTARLVFLLLLGGVLSALAMIVPGLSGSFMLLLIGLYRTVIQAVSDFNLPLLLFIALGVIIGIFSGAACIRWLLSRFPRQTYGAVLGLVIGSIYALFPGFGEGFTIFVSIVTLLAGAAISFFAGRRE